MSVHEQVARNSERYLKWLNEACSIESLADRPDELERMVAWLEERFAELSMPSQRLPYEGAPDALLATGGSGLRSVLIYDHYDVQPVDPIELWASKPFQPEIRDGRFFARGAADNKGDLVARLAALEIYREEHGELPVRVKFIVEGEEETGSGSFEKIALRYRDEISADGCIWEGVGIDHRGRPELVFGAKGLVYVELYCRTLTEDQHSSIAVIAPNPAWRLIEALSTLRRKNGTVSIDGFYDDVVEPSDDDLAMLERVPFEEKAEKERLGIGEFVGGGTGIDLLRRLYFAPTCNIAGLVSGYTVPGASKTVLPKDASVKLDMRLVPDQDPADIVTKLRKHLEARGFDDIGINASPGEHPVRSPADSAIGAAAIAAAEEVFDEDPAVSPLMIGAGPMYPIAKTLGIPTVSPAGVHRPDSNIHAPNENCRVDDFLRIVEYTVAWLRHYAANA